MTMVNLEGRIADLGSIHFVRVEWSRPGSRLVRIHCLWDRRPREFVLRMDLDKKAIIDDLEVEPAALRDRANRIWKIVAENRSPAV